MIINIPGIHYLQLFISIYMYIKMASLAENMTTLVTIHTPPFWKIYNISSTVTGF